MLLVQATLPLMALVRPGPYVKITRLNLILWESPVYHFYRSENRHVMSHKTAESGQ